MKLSLKEFVSIAIGEASMAWNPRPSGVFDSTHASKICDALLLRFNAEAEPLILLLEECLGAFENNNAMNWGDIPKTIKKFRGEL
jgi:hypothetical protein